MAKNSISQLDLVLLGRRGLTARIGSVEGQVRRLTSGSTSDATPVSAQDLRPNLFTNSSFEFFDRGATVPKDWTAAGGALLSIGSAGADGTNSVRLPAGASISQKAAGGATVPQCSIVVSVAARTDYANQKISIAIAHSPGGSPGASLGTLVRIDQDGNEMQTDDVPADGQWYRFYRGFILAGGADVTAYIAQAGTGTLEVDAAKFEKEDGVASWLEPTAFITADWGAATHIRNLAAENIITGTLVVGGSISSNPRISVKDGSDAEIVTIGQPTGGFYGIDIKGAAGFRISGSGSAEVLGGGSVKVKGGGAVSVEGGNINVTNGSINVSAATGGINVNGGGSVNVGDTGSVLVSGSGVVRVGNATGKRIVLGASGLEAYDASNNRRLLLDVDTATLRVFGAGAINLETGGSLNAGGGLAWADSAGLWATDQSGNAAFGVSGLDAHLWGGISLDKGDVLLGKAGSYVWWDASAQKLKMSGELSVAGGNVVINDAGIQILTGDSSVNAVNFYSTLNPGYLVGGINGSDDPGTGVGHTGGISNINIGLNSPTGGNAQQQLWLAYDPTAAYAETTWKIALTDSDGTNSWQEKMEFWRCYGLWLTTGLHVGGNYYNAAARGQVWADQSIKVGNDAIEPSYGELSTTGSIRATTSVVVRPATSGGSASIEVGGGSTGNRVSYLDFTGDDTYTDFGLRIIRNNGGANTTSDLQHRGTGALRLMATDNGAVRVFANGSLRFEATATGVAFNGASAIAKPTVTALTGAFGTTGDAIADVGTAFNQATLNANFRRVEDKINAIRTALVNLGLVG